jgi:serine/threonine protein kinase
LEYLHQQHIIYRDLKSENVLVWQMPGPFTDKNIDNPAVFAKLADYGISRPTLPTGAKGFGGTEGFMAPEIVKYNGEEEYTEKVDCFSFGMFIYELVKFIAVPAVCLECEECILSSYGRERKMEKHNHPHAHPPTHTHTHTHRERERERVGKKPSSEKDRVRIGRKR